MWILSRLQDTSMGGVESNVIIYNTEVEAFHEMRHRLKRDISDWEIPLGDVQKIMEYFDKKEDLTGEFTGENWHVECDAGGYSVSINEGEDEFRCRIDEAKPGQDYGHDL